MNKKIGLGLISAATLFIGLASAQAAVKPAIVYDLGGKFDKSFNEAAYTGGMLFKKETGIRFRDFEITNDSQREQALRNFARRGMSPIVAVGFSQATAVEKVAKEFPETRFAIIDSVVDLPNVDSILFKEHEGSYLVGVLAMLASQSGKVGFVGGMDIPLIRKFACGYVQGARSVKADSEIFQNMTGSTGAAWNDPVKGGELAKSQFDRGADVVYHAAGGTGLGVLQKAADEGKLGIGVDSNQNHLHPGKVLTSMLKRVDIAIAKLFTDANEGKLPEKGQVIALGLKEGGVDWAQDEHNAPLITDKMKKAVAKAREDIVTGTVKVHDYMSDNNCPVK